MVIVIIAGGSGTRLWPLSQGNHPKHLLSLTNENSMLQNTYRRARLLSETVFVVTEASHSAEVAQQLPDMEEHQLIVEPGRRNTASCVILALARVQAHHGEHEEVVFLHADHHIIDQEGFAQTVRAAAAASARKRAIALIGLKPTYPATGFGYIQSGETVLTEEGLPVHKVMSFKEKPAYDVAEQYLAAGNYLWNLGLFAAPLGVWTEQFSKYSPYHYEAYLGIKDAVNEAAVTELYLALKSAPIDTALIEKTPRLVVVPGSFDWADIGSFFDLHKILRDKENGNAIKGNIHMIDCEDSMIHGTDKPVIAIGLSGIVVVDTPEGLLVCSKEQSQLVGELSKQLKD
jgi:mannose-1-phosphate guanylyltransferase/mannose-6-phosphate isomerase